MKGLELPHEFEIAVDGERVHLATIGGTEDFTALMRNITEAADAVGKRSSTTVPLTAGVHDISVGFVYAGAQLGTTRLQPFLRSSQDILDATGHPHIETLTVTGPYNATGPATPRRARGSSSCRPARVGRRRAARVRRGDPVRAGSACVSRHRDRGRPRRAARVLRRRQPGAAASRPAFRPRSSACCRARNSCSASSASPRIGRARRCLSA